MARKQSFVSFYRNADKRFSKYYYRDVINDIENNIYIKKRIKEFRKSFIKYTALERMDFKPDIVDELDSYLKRLRMHHTNVKEWKRLRQIVFKRDNYTCKYCNNIGGILEVDHIHPFSKGGSDDLSNLTTSCRKCNRKKRDKTAIEFINN